MRISLTFFSLLLFSTILLAQDRGWTKGSRTIVFEEYMSLLSKYNLQQGQKETVALCCVEEVVKQFTKADYDIKMEIEIKRLQSGTITNCSQKAGIELKEEAKAEWNKDAKQSLLNQCALLYDEYKVTYEQKESLSYCAMQKITQKYTLEQFNSLLPLEEKKLREDTFRECNIQNNITLKKKKKSGGCMF
jgi:hypothetical protein